MIININFNKFKYKIKNEKFQLIKASKIES